MTALLVVCVATAAAPSRCWVWVYTCAHESGCQASAGCYLFSLQVFIRFANSKRPQIAEWLLVCSPCCPIISVGLLCALLLRVACFSGG